MRISISTIICCSNFSLHDINHVQCEASLEFLPCFFIDFFLHFVLQNFSRDVLYFKLHPEDSVSTLHTAEGIFNKRNFEVDSPSREKLLFVKSWIKPIFRLPRSNLLWLTCLWLRGLNDGERCVGRRLKKHHDIILHRQSSSQYFSISFFFFERFERKINEARAIAFMLGTCSAECFTKTEINKQKIFDSAM